MVVVLGGDSLGSAFLAGSDVGPAQHRLVTACVLGVAAKRAAPQRRLVAGGHGRAGGLPFVLKVELVGLVFIVSRDVAGHLGAFELLGVGGQNGPLDFL